ncbi:glutamate receptor-like [Portunus trituberculatus]|uniref:glutamate receptor-like n=1 Tax=Portunus trituberculatus TaxID=210409 RepID=UPI001E1D1C65|nr:glutamate receptor-like [Portunus trituberculatus]
MTVEVRMASWMVVVVVVSDDPVFLAAFAQQAREGRLLVWATRLIVVSRRVPHSLYPLHQTLALTSSLLLVVDVAAGNARSCDCLLLCMLLKKGHGQTDRRCSRATGWMVLPYQRPGVAPLRVASWTPRGNLSLHRPLFWDKFSKFSGETNLVVAMERNLKHTVVEKPDSTAPGGVRVLFKGFMVTVVNYLAQGLNFSRVVGAKIRNGSFTGMLGQVNKEQRGTNSSSIEGVYLQEVHFGLGPFGINAARYEAVDFTWPLSFVDVKVFAGRGSAEVDPWGFLLPLAPWVWTILLSTLLLLSVTSSFLSRKFSQEDLDSNEVLASNMLYFVSIVLRQFSTHSWLLTHLSLLTLAAVWVSKGEWWWQRVVLGMWMLMTMVLMRSYEGNLMSLLAVRHLPQPYQTLRDVVDDPSVVMVWHKQGSPIQSVMVCKHTQSYFNAGERSVSGKLITIL